jgi:hypothetical protein
MAESGHVLIESTILSFAWRNEENHENLSQGLQNLEAPKYKVGVTQPQLWVCDPLID